jgi:hypothetical protein
MIALNFHTNFHVSPTSQYAVMGEPAEYVTLVSSDGFEFKVLRSAACLCFLDCPYSRRYGYPFILIPVLIAGFKENAQNLVKLETIKYASRALCPLDVPCRTSILRSLIKEAKD